MQGLGYPSHCPHTAPRVPVRVPVVADVSELSLKTRPETSISSFQHYEETAVTRSLVYLKKVKLSRYRPGVAQRVGRGIALLCHDRGTRRG